MKKSSRKKKMSANLPYEFGKFSKNSKQLRRIWKDTKFALEDIAKSGYFNQGQLEHLRLSAEDDRFISSAVSHPVALVILGQSCWAKACVVNELFGQSVLPVMSPSSEEGQLTWRMVRFTHGVQTEISLALPNSYELVEHLAAYDQPWHTIPRADLELEGDARQDPALSSAVLEIRMKHPLLKDDVQVIVTPCNHSVPFEQMYTRTVENTTPVLIYAIADEVLSEKEMSEVMELKKVCSKAPVFFIKSNLPSTSELTESEQHARSLRTSSHSQMIIPNSFPNTNPNLIARSDPAYARLRNTSVSLYQQLCSVGYLNPVALDHKTRDKRKWTGVQEVESELVENFENFPSILLFVRHVLQSVLVSAATRLNETHNKCLRMFILTAFDMTWDMLITPKRLEYAAQREIELYHNLMEIANSKQEEIRQLIVNAVDTLKDEILEKAANYDFQDVISDESDESSTSSSLQTCSSEIQDMVLGMLNSSVAEKLVGSINCLRESFVGTLERCLVSLEEVCKEEESIQASNALKQILNAAYQVEVTVKTSSSFLRVIWEKMKQLMQTLPGRSPPRIDKEWKQKVASDMLESLSEWRLARCIRSQFRDRLKISHEQFTAALRQLEAIHSGRLERTESQRLKVRKVHAPRIARYALESISLRDVILHGMPQLGRELGRGQYGVVYACDSWGGCSPCAIKSVVPPDDKHWNDLAMEFFYTRSIPEHERIVQIRGSVIDHNYAGGTTPAVLLIMEKLQRDLYTALRVGLEWLARLQVALDVVQGIRFLHSQGLVHRDIKLKNVLLDKKNRAKLTDLGFCKPEAMMSGSIVGTPIHMAPELFTGRYDNSVDTYAFGILFWYICAGHVKLPYVFEQCQTKDQLWSCVRKGARPERLPQFDRECWHLMERCWASDPSRRPLLGDVELALRNIMAHYENSPEPTGFQGNAPRPSRSRASSRQYMQSPLNKYEMAIPGTELSFE